MFEAWSAVLGAIVDGATACSAITDIAEVLACDDDSVSEVLCELEVNGLVERWAQASGLTYTLSALAAEGLRVHIVEHGLAARARWERIRERRGHRRTRGRPSEDAALARAIDPATSSAEAAEAADEAEHWRPKGPLKVDQLPRPTILLTGADTDWGETDASGRTQPIRAARRKPGPCSACHGRPLRASTYCLRCRRWGLDGLIAAHRRAKAAADQAAG
jgi:hypothetical protein